MKKISLLLILSGLFAGIQTYGQLTDKDWKYLVMREDVVMPSNTATYEAALADVTNFFKTNNIQGVFYLTQLQDNYHYTHISALNNFEDLDEGLLAYVTDPSKKTELQLLMDNLNNNLETSKIVVVKYRPELSYTPDNNIWLEKAPYRRFNFFYFFPGMEKEIENVLTTWKTLYQQKGVENGFRVFTGMVGLDRPVYILTTWSADPLTYQQNLQDNMKKLGDEGAKVWISTMEMVRDVETIEGWYLPQYSYIPAK